MENKIYNDDVERIVNDPERQASISELHHKMKTQKHRKMLLDAAVYSALGWLIYIIGIKSLLVDWIAFPVSFSCCMYASFCFGRWFENGKCKGWK